MVEYVNQRVMCGWRHARNALGEVIRFDFITIFHFCMPFGTAHQLHYHGTVFSNSKCIFFATCYETPLSALATKQILVTLLYNYLMEIRCHVYTSISQRKT